MVFRILSLFALAAVLAGTISSCNSDSPNQSRIIDTPAQTVTLRDYEYAEGRIYDLMPPGYLGPTDRVVALRVFETPLTGTPDQVSQLKVAKFRSHPDSLYDVFSFVTRVEELEQSEFEWYDDTTLGQHYVVFHRSYADFPLGIWMRVEKRDYYGNILDTFEIGQLEADTLVIKTLRALPGFSPGNPAWDLVWRNCYVVPRGFEAEELNLQVFRGGPGTEGTVDASDYLQDGLEAQTYLQILGLDQINNGSSERFPDKVLDNVRSVYRPDWGLVIFPDRTPFDTDTTFLDGAAHPSLPIPERVPSLYHYESIAERVSNSKYFIQYQMRAVH